MKQVKGFTLLEVLIAMVILALAFSTAYLSLSRSARNLLRIEHRTASQWVGMNVIARAQTGVLALGGDNSGTSGSDRMFNDTWSWTLAVIPTPAPNVFKMLVDVRDPGTDNVITHLTAYLYKSDNS